MRVSVPMRERRRRDVREGRGGSVMGDGGCMSSGLGGGGGGGWGGVVVEEKLVSE